MGGAVRREADGGDAVGPARWNRPRSPLSVEPERAAVRVMKEGLAGLDLGLALGGEEVPGSLEPGAQSMCG